MRYGGFRNGALLGTIRAATTSPAIDDFHDFVRFRWARSRVGMKPSTIRSARLQRVMEASFSKRRLNDFTAVFCP